MISSEEQIEDLEDLYENAPCGYLSLGQDRRIIKVNRTLCEWLGYTHEEILGRSLSALLNVPGKIFFETHFAPLLRMQGFFEEVALDLVKNDGTSLAVLANASERRDAKGSALFTRVTLLRATQRRRYERQLVDAQETARQAKDDLEKINAALSAGMNERIAEIQTEKENALLREQFIAVLGHDLRNPLAGLSAGTKMLAQMQDDPRSERILRLMGESIIRMSGLVENLMDFARGRLGSGIGITPTYGEELEPTLMQVINELQAAHPEHKIDIDFKLTQPLSVDHARIAQMFSNLLANAINHGSAGLPVTVTAHQDGGEFLLSVSNKGTPIAQATMERLFQPFHRGEVTPHSQGLGLGLYIASQIAKAHGGHIEVNSTSDETRFTFRMPQH